MKEEERANLEDDYRKKLRDFERNYKDSQADLQKKDNELTGAIIKDLQEVIRDYGEREGYTLILEATSSAVLYGTKSADLTDEVMKRTTARGPARRSRMIGYHEIAALLPHRFPFQFIDRVLEFEDGERIVALKNVSINEPFFRGHFPEQPLMPGVLICEALAQAGALLAHRSTDGVGPGRVVRAHRARPRALPPPGAARRPAAPRGDRC